jgi:hypothetical protein
MSLLPTQKATELELGCDSFFWGSNTGVGKSFFYFEVATFFIKIRFLIIVSLSCIRCINTGGSIGFQTETPHLFNNSYSDVTAGPNYSIIVDKNYKAYSSGFIDSKLDYSGYLGIDPSKLSDGPNTWQIIDRVVDTNGQEIDPPNFLKVYAGASDATPRSGSLHSLLIDEEGRVFTMGNNAQGQLCLGDNESRTIPHQVSLNDTSPAVAAAIGDQFTLILLENGLVYGCGSNVKGQLGLGREVESVNVPNNRNGLTGVVDISAGMGYALFLDEFGLVHGTGSNEFRQQCYFWVSLDLFQPTVS